VKWMPGGTGRRTTVDVALWQQQQPQQRRHHSAGHHHMLTGYSPAIDFHLYLDCAVIVPQHHFYLFLDHELISYRCSSSSSSSSSWGDFFKKA